MARRTRLAGAAQRWAGDAESVWTGMADWRAAHPKATLSEIEEALGPIRKVIGGFRSAWGAEASAICTSILATARNRRQNLHDAFLAIACPSPLQAIPAPSDRPPFEPLVALHVELRWRRDPAVGRVASSQDNQSPWQVSVGARFRRWLCRLDRKGRGSPMPLSAAARWDRVGYVRTERTRDSGVAAAYAPIGEYAVIGDCRTAGLVSRDGSLDFLCPPRFDSPTIFAALLDAQSGGRFRARPVGTFRSTRAYVSNTNVLETTFITDSGTCVLRDLMPVTSEEEKRRAPLPEHLVLRELEGLAGSVEIEVLFEPRPDYARRGAELEARGALGLWSEVDGAACVLRSDLPLDGHQWWSSRRRHASSAGR